MKITLEELIALEKRKALRDLLKEAIQRTDEELHALGYLLWTIKKSQAAPNDVSDK